MHLLFPLLCVQRPTDCWPEVSHNNRGRQVTPPYLVSYIFPRSCRGFNCPIALRKCSPLTADCTLLDELILDETCVESQKLTCHPDIRILALKHLPLLKRRILQIWPHWLNEPYHCKHMEQKTTLWIPFHSPTPTSGCWGSGLNGTRYLFSNSGTERQWPPSLESGTCHFKSSLM